MQQVKKNLNPVKFDSMFCAPLTSINHPIKIVFPFGGKRNYHLEIISKKDVFVSKKAEILLMESGNL